MLDPGPPEQQSIGALFSQLVDDGKAFARAEAAVFKARGRVAGIALGLGGAGLLIVMGAITALLVGLILALAAQIGALLATLVVVAAALLVAGLLFYLAWRRFKIAMNSEPAP